MVNVFQDETEKALMLKFFLIIFFFLSCIVVFGQGNMNGEYVGQVYISDTNKIEIQLSLNCDKTFKMNFSHVEAVGKWAMTSSKTLRLKADYSKVGCFGSDKKTVIKFLVEGNKIIWKGTSHANNRKIERELMKSTGEKVEITRTEKETLTPTVLVKAKSFQCD